MMVETSAIVAIILNEAEAEHLWQHIERAEAPFTSYISQFEAALVLSTRLAVSVVEALDLVRAFCERGQISIHDLSAASITAAAEAHDRFGKGRGHPAQLNLGDCLSYGMARAAGAPLLFKGADFAASDIARP